MIRELSNGIKVVELGLGTTQVSQVIYKDYTASSGICFSNQVPIKGELTGEEIIIEINGFKGVLAYIIPIFELIESWDICSKEDTKIVKDTIESFKLKMKE